jgi:hypothetical protein
MEPVAEWAKSVRKSAEKAIVHVEAKSVKRTRSRSELFSWLLCLLNCDVNQAARASYKPKSVSFFLFL